MRVKIREMEQVDLASVMELERRIFPTPWSIDVFKHEIRRRTRSIYLVAELDDRILGYLGAGMMGQEVHIANIAVEPEWRRQGIGTALLLECIGRGSDRGARWLTLEVRETNAGARDFYRLFGFNELGLRIGYYVDTGEPALVMATGDICSDDYREMLNRLQAKLARREAGE
jgi:ribosomal-protein-alanine N-acetyltransferase